ncbi:hypothetical protein ACEN2I_03625 [Flavobacterium sp. W22_SRS_FK3]|uniref:hypothetical protein n=1 Tax=Flavobacterium sp. W22_SRS_FK3 TaxID=3240275 RepID=UPI003F928121
MSRKKILIINLLMSLTVLFAMLFQTIHSYEHVYRQLTEKHCDHNYGAHKNQITHIHSVENNCPVCHFSFSTFISNQLHSLTFQKVKQVTSTVFFYKTVTSPFFKGSLFALRAPPALF